MNDDLLDTVATHINWLRRPGVRFDDGARADNAQSADYLERLAATLREQARQLEAVSELHTDNFETGYCEHDGFAWPCPTFRALASVVSTPTPENEQCPTCHGEGGGHVRIGADDWDWEPCERCRGAGYMPVASTPPEEP